MLVHLALHLSLKEGGEQPLDQELLLHLDLVLILVLIGSHFSNLGLSLDSLHSSSEGILLVPDGLLQALDSLLSLPLVHLDLHHNLVELHFGLDPLLLGSSLLV